MNVTPIIQHQLELGCLARDVITRFEGICIGRVEMIDGTIIWTLEQQTGKGNPRLGTESFPEGRLERIGDGVCHAIRSLKSQRGK